ncbi:Leucine-rich repeat receptor-like protein kinase TDR [Linum perenne]
MNLGGNLGSSLSKFLHLGGNDFDGPLPPQLGFLTQLERMEIGYNSWSGRVLVEFFLLINLQYLDISTCFLPGNLTEELGNLTQLHPLLLFKNQFTGEIPQSFAELKSIRVLDLSENRLTGVIPKGISKLKELTRLKHLLCPISMPPWLHSVGFFCLCFPFFPLFFRYFSARPSRLVQFLPRSQPGRGNDFLPDLFLGFGGRISVGVLWRWKWKRGVRGFCEGWWWLFRWDGDYGGCREEEGDGEGEEEERETREKIENFLN